jgi:hypothetical protein
MRKQLIGALGALSLAVSGSALAGGFGLGEVFTAPTTDSFLESVFTGELSGITSGAGYEFDLFPYFDDGTLGPALFQQSTTGPVAPNQTINVDVQLASDQMYAFTLLATDFGSVSTTDDAAIPNAFLASCFDTSCTPVVGAFGTFDIEDFKTTFSASPVPEPTTLALLGMGLLGIGLIRRKRES